MANAVVRGLLSVAGLAWALGAQAGPAGETFVAPQSKAAGLTSCVEPTDFMRRNHMELIKHERHIVVHQGIRDSKYSLAGCVDCHVAYGPDQEPVSVHAEGQFCSRCHEYAAVDVNCFGCHSTVPNGVQGNAALSGDYGPEMVQVQGAGAGGDTP